MIAIAAMTEIGNHAERGIWPSLEWATWWFDRASFGLIVGTLFVLISTVLIVWMGIVKEHHWDALRERSSTEIAKAQAEAGHANEAAGKAHERAAALEADAEKARAELGKATASIADANARAAEAAQKAAEAQLALERFRAPRVLNAADTQRLIERLSPFAGTNAAVYILGEGPEPSGLGAMIRTILDRAGWEGLTWNWVGVGAIIGVLVLSKPGEGALDEACNALVDSLNGAGILTARQPWPGNDWAHFGGMLNGPNPPDPAAAPIRIIIGTKPQ